MSISEEPTYNIKSVSNQTGIPATTLRAWERRYGVLQPSRTSGNYRLYSDRDVMELNWLKNQLSSGLSISRAVAALEQRRQVQAEGDLAQPLTNQDWLELRKALYATFINHDEQTARDVLEQAHPLEAACTQLITPVLAQIWQGWHDGRVSIATEHFASHILMGRLFAIFDDLPKHTGDLVLAGCAPGELHQIGSLMLAVILRERGMNVRYLGANLPLTEWTDAIAQHKPAVIAISCSKIENGHELLMLLPFRGPARKYQPKLVLGGMAFAGFAQTYADNPHVFVEQTVVDGVNRIENIIHN